MEKKLMKLKDNIGGEVSFYYKNLVTGELITSNPLLKLKSASVIKLFILAKVLKEIEDGRLMAEMTIDVRDSDKVPSCGALYYMDSGLRVTIRDLYTLMIVHSDNTATNILIDLLKIEGIGGMIMTLGCRETELNRKMFDWKGQEQGLENYTCTMDVGQVLEGIYRRELISETISMEMERVLKLQRLNSKIPYLLPRDVEIGHKTGEGEGITHDVGIIYSKNPFIFCFSANGVDVVRAEDGLRKMAKILYDYSN